MNGIILAIPKELDEHSDRHLEKSKTYSDELQSTEMVLDDLLATKGQVMIRGDYADLIRNESNTLSDAITEQITSEYDSTGDLLKCTAEDRREINSVAEEKAAGNTVVLSC